MRSIAVAAALLYALGGARAQEGDGCPQGSRRFSTPDAARPYVCGLEGARYTQARDCPSGTRAMVVEDPDAPMRCVYDKAEPRRRPGECPPGTRAVPSKDIGKPLECVGEGAAPGGFKTETGCPKGFHKVITPKGLRGFRCEAGTAKPAKPQAGHEPVPCPKGTRRVTTENPFDPVQCVPAAEQSLPPLTKDGYVRFELPGEMRFDYPAGWKLDDDWKAQEPGLYARLDTGREGKQVTLTVNRLRRRAPSFVEMDQRIEQEKDWHGAKEGGRGSAAGLPARYLEVPNQSKMAVLARGDGYLVVSYTAPDDLFARYLPAWSRLLKSLRVVHAEDDPVPGAGR